MLKMATPTTTMIQDDNRIVRVAQKFLDSITFTLNLVVEKESIKSPIIKAEEDEKRQSNHP